MAVSLKQMQKYIKENKMIITKLKYTEDTLNWVSITFEDGSTGQSSLTDGIRRQYTDIVQEYLDAGGVVESQSTDAELAKQEQERLNSEARAYLSETDWMLIRELDGGVAMPLDVKQKRAEARSRIV